MIDKVVGIFERVYLDKRNAPPPFPILKKKFQAKKKFSELIACISERTDEYGHVHREYNDGKRHHRTDGFILTPNLPYQAKGDPKLWKWKYTDLVGQIAPSRLIDLIPVG